MSQTVKMEIHDMMIMKNKGDVGKFLASFFENVLVQDHALYLNTGRYKTVTYPVLPWKGPRPCKGPPPYMSQF